jgi:branched-chain amino acid transport system substrate-binding protein
MPANYLLHHRLPEHPDNLRQPRLSRRVLSMALLAPRSLTTATLTGIVLLLAACSGSSSVPAPDSVPHLATSVAPQTSDGILRIGLLIPQSGPGAAIGEPLIAIAQAAIDLVNANGGVMGQDVEMIVRDEGADAASALTSIDDFLANDGIDVLIGPLSSPITLSVLPRLMESNIGTCSPSATAISLASFPDEGLFIRTTPSDGLLAQAMARLVAQTGITETSIAYPDDSYGRDFVVELRRALLVRGISVTFETAFAPANSDYSSLAEELSAQSKGVITLIGDSESGARFLNSLVMANSTHQIVVNDPLSAADLSTNENLNSSIRRNIIGVAANAFAGVGKTSAEHIAFSAAIVDCVNLLTLGSIAAGSDNAIAIMSQVIITSRGGSGCGDFPTCLALLKAKLNIDYNGSTGQLDLDPNGDPSRASFLTFGFGNNGLSAYKGPLDVMSAP